MAIYVKAETFTQVNPWKGEMSGSFGLVDDRTAVIAVGSGQMLSSTPLNDQDAFAAKAIVAQEMELEVCQVVIATLLPPSEEIPTLIPFEQSARKALELTFRIRCPGRPP